VRFCASGIECGSGLTIVEVRDCLQDVTVGVEHLWPTDTAGEVPVRVQDDPGVGEVPGGDSLIQSFTESSGSRHVCRGLE